MSIVPACVFPQTVPHEKFLVPLLPVFQNLVYLKPIEEEGLPQENKEPPIQELVQQERLSFWSPAPLGSQKDRFCALIQDIKNNRETYASQIAHLGVAQLSAGTPESLSTITASLSQDRVSRSEQELIETLWQARLVLELAEIQDNEQEEIFKDLEELRKKQDALFCELREETENDFLHLNNDQQGLSTSSPGFLHRLKAWTRLFVLGQNPLPSQKLFVTTSVDAADLLLERAADLDALNLQSACCIPLSPAAENKATPARAEMALIWEKLLQGEEHLPDPAQPLPYLPAGIPAEKKSEGSLLCLYPIEQTPPADLFCRTFTPGLNPDKQEATADSRWIIAVVVTP